MISLAQLFAAAFAALLVSLSLFLVVLRLLSSKRPKIVRHEAEKYFLDGTNGAKRVRC